MKKLNGIILFTIVLFSNLTAQQLQLVLPVGHTDILVDAVFSPDGKMLVTASYDNTAKVWDCESGKILFTLDGHSYGLSSAQFSPDSKRILTASVDNTAIIWDSENGKPLITLIGHKEGINSAKYSPDGKKIVTASGDNTAKVWDSENGKLLLTLKGHKSYLQFAQFSPDGKKIVSASSDNTAKVWDADNGKLLLSLEGHSAYVNTVYFSSDGRKIVTSSNDNSAIVWDSNDGKIMSVLEGHSSSVNSALFSPDNNSVLTSSSDNSAIIWDAQSGKLLLKLEGHSQNVINAQFSPDGENILTASWDKSAKVWDTQSGKLLFSLEGHTEYIESARFSSDGKRIVTTSTDKTAKVWDVSTGNLLFTCEGHTTYVDFAKFSPDGKKIVTVSRDKTVKIWDAANIELIFNLHGHTDVINSVQFSFDSKKILTASSDSSAKVWDIISGKLLLTLKAHADEVYYAQFSPDGKMIVTASADNTSRVWDAENGKLLFTLEGHSEKVYYATFSPDSKMIVTASFDNSAKVWNAKNGELLYNLDGHKSIVFSAQFSSDGNKIVTASDDHTAKVWNAENGELLFTLKNHKDQLNSAQFSPDSKRIITTSRDNTAIVWDCYNGKLLFTIEGHTGYGLSAQFSPDGKKIVTASWDNTAKIWDAESGKQIKDIRCNGMFQDIDFDNNTLISHNNSRLTFWNIESGLEKYSCLAVNSTDYLVMHLDGYYDGTTAARDYLYFVCGTEIIDLTQMKDALYVPRLVDKIINGQDINYPKLEDLDICGTLPLIERVENEKLNYNYKITPRKLGLEYVEVYVNAKKIYTFNASELPFENGYYSLEMSNSDITKHFMTGGANEVNVVAISKQGDSELRSRGVMVKYQFKEENKTKPKLYAVIIGVNEYKDPTLNLHFPVKDATDFGKSLEISAKLLLGAENVIMYYVHSNVTTGNGYTTPEKEGIRKTLEEIGKIANPEDVVLIFFAGHGIMQGEENKEFAFLTADASRSDLIGISTKELQNWLSFEGPNKILANKTILIFDACNSGQATQDLIAMARNDDDTQKIRQVEDLKDKSGMFILAGSAPNQSAYELPQYEQGLLTYSLLYVLKNNPDILDDGKYLNVQKWFLESEEYLHELVSSMGYDQDAQPYGTANIRIGEVDEDVRNSIHLAEEKPMLLCANVLNENTFNDDLQLKDNINKQLIKITENGTASQIIFSKQEAANVNKINILYSLTADEINCRLSLIKNNQTIYEAKISGNSKDIDALVNKIIEGVVGNVK
jgi:WD40 repeat protein